MTPILLALMLAQPGDPLRSAEQDVAVRLGEASNRLDDDDAEAERLLTALLDDPATRLLVGRSRTVGLYLDSAVFVRARARLALGRAREVADEMTALLDSRREQFHGRIAALAGSLASPHAPLTTAHAFHPTAPLNRWGWYQPLTLRAEALKALGEHDKEQADRDTMAALSNEILQGLRVPGYDRPLHVTTGRERSWWLDRLLAVPELLQSLVARPWLVPVVFAATIHLFFLMGLRQRRDAGGSWRRLFLVSLALAALQTAPIVAAFLLAWRDPDLPYDSALAAVALAVFVIGVFRHRGYLVAVTWERSKQAPPLLDDAAIQGRIVELAGRMGLAAPVTRVVRSATPLQTNNALVAGLVAPTMVLFDGILHRLSPEERDAIIAHELGHLANGTFWVWACSGAACSVAVVAASAYYPFLVAFGLGLALWLGTWIILSRRLELDCDRRAARAIGHQRASSALWKVHADQPYRGVLEFLVGAIGTHPSRDERLAAVRADAPADDRPDVEWQPRTLANRRRAAWVAAGLWLAVIVASLAWGWRSPHSSWPALPLFLIQVTVFVVFWLALRKDARRASRLQRTRRIRATVLTWLSWLLPGFLVAWAIALYFGLTARINPWTSVYIQVGVLLAWGVVAVVRRGRGRADKLNHRFAVAFQSGDYQQALAVCEGSPKVVAGSVELRYNHALIRAVLGRRDEALADLERLRQEEPTFKMTWLMLAGVYGDEGEFSKALDLGVELSRDLPGEPLGPQIEACMLRKVGRLDEAEARARRALEMEPKAGDALLALAGVALDRGDFAEARERLVPGSVGGALTAAEIALAADDPAADDAVRQALAAAKNNPLAFGDKEAAGLARRLEERRQSEAGVAAEVVE